MMKNLNLQLCIVLNHCQNWIKTSNTTYWSTFQLSAVADVTSVNHPKYSRCSFILHVVHQNACLKEMNSESGKFSATQRKTKENWNKLNVDLWAANASTTYRPHMLITSNAVSVFLHFCSFNKRVMCVCNNTHAIAYKNLANTVVHNVAELPQVSSIKLMHQKSTSYPWPKQWDTTTQTEYSVSVTF